MTPAPIDAAAPAPARRAPAARAAGAPEPITAEAAVVLALAETTVPFASSRRDEAERWLRVLRQDGYVGRALQALGVDEAQLATRAEPRRRSASANPADPVGAVAVEAARLARRRGGDATTTLDVLFAAFIDYGRLFDRALYLAGVSRRELIAELHGRAPVAR